MQFFGEKKISYEFICYMTSMIQLLDPFYLLIVDIN